MDDQSGRVPSPEILSGGQVDESKVSNSCSLCISLRRIKFVALISSLRKVHLMLEGLAHLQKWTQK